MPRIFCSACMAMIGWVIISVASPSARGQMIVPVAPGMHAPGSFDFRGHWVCTDGTKRAVLSVGSPDGQVVSDFRAPSWTELREHEDWFSGRYFIAFDRDRKQFLLIDADDPAVLRYSTEGWHRNRLLLNASGQKEDRMPPTRILYVVVNPHQFAMTWEMFERGAWRPYPESTCSRTKQQLP